MQNSLSIYSNDGDFTALMIVILDPMIMVMMMMNRKKFLVIELLGRQAIFNVTFFLVDSFVVES